MKIFFLLTILLIGASSYAENNKATILPLKEIKEKAGFALGITGDKIEISNIRADGLSVKFNAIFEGRVFQCYYTGFEKVTSDALCSPTDGKPLPTQTKYNPLINAR